MSTNNSLSVWPDHFQVGALRLVRSSVHYEATIAFYRDLVGLEVIDVFEASYGEDGTIFGLPGSSVHLEVVRSHASDVPIDAFDQLVFYLPDQAATNRATSRLVAEGVNPVARQHPYWDDNGGVTFRDPDGRTIVYVSWVYEPAPRRP